MMTKRLLLLLVPVLAIACGSSPSTPSSTGTTTPITESFEVTLAPGDTAFYSFSQSSAASVTVTLTSLVRPGRAAAVAAPLTIGLGTPAGEGCTVTDSAEVTPALTSQLATTMGAGVHCISVTDAGQLADAVIASIRFTHQ